jgi:lipopolysaccharide/colanic/teichoic acid biosynthesis glycosyltransferase
MIRFLDIIFSSTALVFLFPFGLIISLILKFTGEGEIFYTQERMGKNGRKFNLLKFATMLKDSPSIGTGDITVKNDPRVLPFGKILRITKINELPQLINILIGDMSIVGPRPQTPKNFDYFSEEQKKIILSMRPGLTGTGSIVFRDEETIVALYPDKPVEDCYREIICPYKGELEKWYQKRQHITTYLLIIFVTMWVVIYSESEIYFRIWPSLPSPPFSNKNK